MNDTFLIDRTEPVKHFKETLQTPKNIRVLRVIGDAKMGKSRLLREYKTIAEDDFKSHCALVDLRSQSVNKQPEDILFSISQQIGSSYFSLYHQISTTEPKIELKNFFSFFSNNFVRSNTDDNVTKRQRQKLVTAFVNDLKILSSSTKIVLLFDAFEEADTSSKAWLIEELTLGLCQVSNIVTVIAGRTVLEAPSSWQSQCYTHQLPPVKLEHHQEYCVQAGIDLPDEVIERFHEAFEGKPGQFAEYTSRWRTNL